MAYSKTILLLGLLVLVLSSEVFARDLAEESVQTANVVEDKNEHVNGYGGGHGGYGGGHGGYGGGHGGYGGGRGGHPPKHGSASETSKTEADVVEDKNEHVNGYGGGHGGHGGGHGGHGGYGGGRGGHPPKHGSASETTKTDGN